MIYQMKTCRTNKPMCYPGCINAKLKLHWNLDQDVAGNWPTKSRCTQSLSNGACKLKWQNTEISSTSDSPRVLTSATLVQGTVASV